MTQVKATKREKQDMIIEAVLASEELSEKVGKLTLAQATAFEQIVVDMYASFLLDNKKVTVGDIGHLEVRGRAGRKGRNPQTGAEIQIAPSKAPAFKPSKTFKEEVKSSK